MYKKISSNKDIEFYDLVLYHYGLEKCMPSHHYGPGVRDVYLIHYIMSGTGIFKTNNKTYQLRQGQGFIIFPDMEIEYEADDKNPWTYCWVGFKGIKADSYLAQANLSLKHPIFSNDSNAPISKLIIKLIDNNEDSIVGDMQRMGVLLNLMSYLIKINSLFNEETLPHDKKEFFVKKVLEFINNNYSMNISIAEIATHLGLNRSYLGSLFKAKTGSTLQSALIKKRINKACELLLNENYSISDISHSVGYPDPLQFSKTFKKVTGVPPSVYRKSII